MAMAGEDKAREERITMEIIVDAYGPEEQAMGWHYYPADNLAFPFKDPCVQSWFSSLATLSAVRQP